MKIGILTHPLKSNYGGILQNYALQTVLKRMGHEVYTIDRINNLPIIVKILSIVKRFLRRIRKENVKIRAWPNQKEEKVILQHIRRFVHNYITTTNKVYNSNKLIDIQKEYSFDAYIVGSDQVWRKRNQPNNENDFLEFLKNNDDIKKIAYAASFGLDEWKYSKKETKKYAKLAKKFDAISVRENSGINLCNVYLGVDAIHTLDPTMLLNKEDYTNILDNTKLNGNEGELFVYILDKDNEKYSFVKELGNKLLLTPFEIMPEQNFLMEFKENQKFNLTKCIFPEVEKWLKAFVDAKFIITDSFHGTVFSIIFNKPFITIINSKRGATRFYSLLSMFGLQSRIVTDSYNLDLEIINQKIDFTKVNIILNKYKEDSFDFLHESLK